MNPLIPIAIEVIGKALDLIKYNQAHAWRNRCAKLQLEIQDEWNKGYNRDDAKVENLMKELKIVIEQASHELDSANP